MGLVIDVIVLAIFRFIRREFRIRQASKWPKVTAAPEDWTCVTPESEYREGWNSLQVEAVLRYEVSGESFSGLLVSLSLACL